MRQVGRIVVILPDELESQFRKEVSKRLGMRRGNMTKAIQESIESWIARKTISLAKYAAEAIENKLKEIESNPELTPEQKEIAKEHFTRRVNELLPEYVSLIAHNVIRELTFPR